MLILFQVLFGLFALAALVGVVSRFKKDVLSRSVALFWIMFWLAATGVVAWPQSAGMLAQTFGIGRGADFILYVSVAALFYLVFRLHITIASLNRTITQVIRDRALNKEETQES